MTHEPSARGRLPATVTVGGRAYRLTAHVRNTPHPGVTAEHIESALSNWVLRGICTDSRGNIANTHWGFVPDAERLMKVVVSLDSEQVITAYLDSAATKNWRRGNIGYFTQRCVDLEVRDAR